MAKTVKDGDTLILKYAQDKGCYVLKADYNQKIGSTRVSLKDVVGSAYTDFYELNDRKLVRVIEANVDTAQESDNDEETKPATDAVKVEENEIEGLTNDLMAKKPVKGDNSGYIDTNTAQKLTNVDLAQFRAQGVSGTEIIKSLTANSSTFDIKSDFAQEKYIKRKEKRYRRTFQLLPANPFTICEAEGVRHRDKVMNLRPDTLAQILGQSGVHAGTHIMVIESMSGMIVGACAYRMQGSGKIIAVYGGQQPHVDMTRHFNLDSAAVAIIQNVPATELGPAAKDVNERGFHTPEPEPPAEPEAETIKLLPEATDSVPALAMEVEDEPSQAVAVPSSSSSQKKRKRNGDDQQQQEKVRDPLIITGRAGEALHQVRCSLRQGVDRLIIACKYRPLPILKQALALLTPSAPFVVFHEYLEPLVECFQYMQDNHLSVRMVLADTWFREFQNLPGRVRPEMFMSATGGYILYGIYIGLPVPYRNSNATDEKAQEVHAKARAAKLEKHYSRGKQSLST